MTSRRRTWGVALLAALAVAGTIWGVIAGTSRQERWTGGETAVVLTPPATSPQPSTPAAPTPSQGPTAATETPGPDGPVAVVPTPGTPAGSGSQSPAGSGGQGTGKDPGGGSQGGGGGR